MNTRKISNDPNKPITIRINLNYEDKLKVKIKCLRKGITLSEMVEKSLLEWINDVPTTDVIP